MNDIVDLKIERVDTPFGEAIQFNFPIKEIFDYLGCSEDYEFFSKLNDNGFRVKPSDLIIASKEDYEEFMAIEKIENRLKPEYKKQLALRNIMIKAVCYDKETRNPVTGKAGAVDYFGKIVVPEIFDGVIGARNLIWVDVPAIVIKDDKYNLTPRDGSGTLLTDWFDRFFRSVGFVWIERNGKFGLLKGTEVNGLIPCEMDWMVGHRLHPSIIIFSKDGKLGFADARFGFDLCHYESPKYDAIDITEGKFLLDGKWTDGPTGFGVFRHIMNNHREATIGFWTDVTEFFSTNKTPHTDIENVILGRQYLKQPLFEFPYNLTSVESFIDELYAATTILKDLDRQDAYFTIRLDFPENVESLITGIDVKLIDGKFIATPHWESTHLELLKRDLRYRNIRNFRAVVSDKDGKFNLSFIRDFSENDFETLAKFLADYLEHHLCLDASSIKTEFILNTPD